MCTADRATFWAVGSLAREQSALVNVPIPVCVSGQARIHSMSATMAWFTPVQAGRRSYRSVRLKLLEPEELGTLRVAPARDQPDSNQIRRGTVSSRRWTGDRAPAVAEGMNVRLVIQREPDQGSPIGENVHFWARHNSHHAWCCRTVRSSEIAVATAWPAARPGGWGYDSGDC